MHFGENTSIATRRSSAVSFDIFPRHSVNLLTGPTSVGKTFFVTHIFNHYKDYFVSNTVSRIYIVLCNERIQPVPVSVELDIPVEQVPLSEFQVEDLSENDLVLIDDVQHLTDTIRLALSVAAHHYNLASLFIVTHSLLGSSNFELLNYCHRVFLFMRAASNIRLSKYIIDHFYAERQIKDYLKSVVEFCAREKNILAFELNRVASTTDVSATKVQLEEQQFLAFSHLTQWTTSSDADNPCPYFLLYPLPMFGNDYSTHFKESMRFGTPDEGLEDSTSDFFNPPKLPLGELPENTCVAIPARIVVAATAAAAAAKNQEKPLEEADEHECAQRDQWNKTMLDIEENIENFFPTHKWHLVKNLTREILKNPNICVTANGRYFHLLDKPTATKTNIISFLALVSRRAGPSEKAKKREWSIYKQHVDNLLKYDTPVEMIVNKLLLPTKYQ